MSIFKRKKPTTELAQGEPPRGPLPMFGDGLVTMPPGLEPPKFGDEQFEAAVAYLVESAAPRRFAVVAHDKDTDNSAVLAWGFDYGDGDIRVDSARNEDRWHIGEAEAIYKYFPEPPEPDCLQILWIDGPGGLAYWRRGVKGLKQSITMCLGFSEHADELIQAAVQSVRVTARENRYATSGSNNPNPYRAGDDYVAAEHCLAEAGAHLAKANYHARHYLESVYGGGRSASD